MVIASAARYRRRVSFWDGRPTLVTGAGGFIGGHLAVDLARRGARGARFLPVHSRGDRGTLDWFDPVETEELDVQFGDLRDVGSVQRAMAGVDVVFHLGAQISIPYSYLNPRDFFATNVGGAMNVAESARAAGVRRLVHMSSSEVYGAAHSFPITEHAPHAPRSPYAASKVAADAVMSSWHASFGVPVVTARAFNTYGPHQSARAIVPTIVTQALRGPVVKLGSLEPRRDLTFVSDTVSGLQAIGAADGVEGETLQLGSGRDVSIGELVLMIGELTGRELEPGLDADRLRPAGSEVQRLLCDPSLTTARTGWLPTVDLVTGLERTIEWLREHAELHRPGDYAR